MAMSNIKLDEDYNRLSGYDMGYQDGLKSRKPDPDLVAVYDNWKKVVETWEKHKDFNRKFEKAIWSAIEKHVKGGAE